MKHFMRLTLKPQKIEATVTCEDHADCAANLLIQEDERESGSYSDYPNFLEWYEGPKTPARSGYINLETYGQFVKWSYVDEEQPIPSEVVENADYDLFYAPVVEMDRGVLHSLKKTSSSFLSEEAVFAYEESLDGFINTYSGGLTELRTGFITFVISGPDMYGDKDFSWKYIEALPITG